MSRLEYEFEVETLNINLAQESESDEILQNVKNILSIPKGSVPSARRLGLDMSFIDRNPIVARTLCVAAIHEAMQQEQRAEVKSVSFETEGTKTKVKVKIARVENE